MLTLDAPRRYHPVARITPDPLRDFSAAEQYAIRLAERRERVKAALASPAWGECYFTNHGANYTAVDTTASEASLLAGLKLQPHIPQNHFDGHKGYGRLIKIVARGVLSTTGAPTIIFQGRLSSTVGSATLTGASVGVSPTITCASGITNKWWELELDLICNATGQGASATTLNCAGSVASHGGFAAPYVYALEPTTPDTATWTAASFDATLTYYFNLSVTWGTSSASNTITCKQLLAYSPN